MVSNSELATLAAWRKLTLSDDPLDRCDAAENFPELHNETVVVETLLSMLDDSDELVRTGAAESLASFEDESVRDALWQRYGVEQSDLVKGYVVSSIGEIGDLRDWPMLQSISESTESIFVKANALAGMHRLSSRNATEKLCSLVKASPDEAGPQITTLMTYLNALWLTDIERFISNTEPLVDIKHWIWNDNFETLKQYVLRNKSPKTGPETD